MVSDSLYLVRCVEMVAGHYSESSAYILSRAESSAYILSSGFVVDHSWKMMHTRQILVSS